MTRREKLTKFGISSIIQGSFVGSIVGIYFGALDHEFLLLFPSIIMGLYILLYYFTAVGSVIKGMEIVSRLNAWLDTEI